MGLILMPGIRREFTTTTPPAEAFGSTASAGTSEYPVRVDHRHAMPPQQAANPDTTGATLAALETEVNELKAALRAVGVLAP